MPLHGAHLGRAFTRAPARTPDDARLTRVLAACSIGLFATNLDFFALNLALPQVGRDLGAASTDLQWVISGYMLALGAFLIPGGRLGDLLGRRRVLLAGLALFGLASAAGGLAPSADALIAFRVLQGIGAAILFPLCVAVVSAAFPAERRARAIGNLYGLGALATAIGPFAGGLLTEALSWRWVLLVNVPVSLIAIALALRAVPDSRDPAAAGGAIDWRGLALVVAGIAAVTFGVDRGDAWGWGSAATLGTVGGGIALLAAFVAVERRVRAPLIDLALLRNRPYVGVTLLGMVANTVFVAATYASMLYLQDVRGYGPIAAGTIFVAASVAVATAGPLSGRLAERRPVPSVMGAGIVVGGLGLLVLALDQALAVYVVALMVFGLGYGLCWSLASVGTQTVVPTAQAGEASGITLAIVVGVAGLGVAVVAAIVEAAVAGGTAEAVAIERVLGAMAAASVVAVTPLVLLARRRTPVAAG